MIWSNGLRNPVEPDPPVGERLVIKASAGVKLRAAFSEGIGLVDNASVGHITPAVRESSPQEHPPTAANLLLLRMVPLADQDGVIGDLEERFVAWAEKHDLAEARRLYWWHTTEISLRILGQRVLKLGKWIVALILLWQLSP